MYIHCTIKFQEVEEIVRNNNFEYYQIDNSDEYVGLPKLIQSMHESLAKRSIFLAFSEIVLI